jgi:putative endonuclease
MIKASLSLQRGQTAENRALQYLTSKGIQHIESNFRAKTGEIDLIVKEGNTLIFLEVKARKSNQYGHPAEFVTPAKQRKIIKTAQLYLLKHPALNNLPCRFDVITMTSVDQANIEWICDAFQCT